jgi:IS30 family transposase
MNYYHLTTGERHKIELLLQQGKTARAIGRILNRHHSTISREINRNTVTGYCPAQADKQYQINKSNCGRKSKFNEDIAKVIQNHLDKTWSPEQISNTVLKGTISYKSIYRWIYNGKLEKKLLKQLRQRGKRQKPAEKRGRFNIGTSISGRPKSIKNRKEFGHWELDTIVSSRGKSKGCLATFAERKTRYYIAVKMPDRTAASMERAIKDVIANLPSGSFKSATTDRGKEFSCYKNIENNYPINIYFADAYCAWQRGTNENSNGLLREFYPKKTDLSLIDTSELISNIILINNRPRKCLKWNSASDLFMKELSHLI